MTDKNESETSEHKYKYKGLPLMPSMIGELVIEYYQGQIIERNKIISEIPTLHKNLGGEESRGSNITSSVKRALNVLKENGKASNPAKGMWQIGEGKTDSPIENKSDDAKIINSQVTKTSSVQQPKIVCDIDFGEGSSAIYFYYYDTYRSTPEAIKSGIWPCKIGRSDRDPMQRVLDQSSTALPEAPHISFIMRTSDPSSWENAIHSILKIRSRTVENSPGTEWFKTNPSEVLKIISLIDSKVDIPKLKL